VVETINIGGDEWLDFLHTQESATPFHHPSWATVVSEVYGLPASAFIIRAPDGTIAAGLPAIRVPSLGRRAVWKCLPFTDTCGPLGGDQETRALMIALREREAEDWEVRSPVPGLATVQKVAVRHCLDLRSGLDAVYAGFHRSQVQRALRRAERVGIVHVREANERGDLTEVYYGLHVDTRKRQGVPPQPRRLFAAIWDELHTAGLASTHLAEIDGLPVAGAVFLHWNRILVYKYGASRTDAWKAHPNHMIFWDAIRKACATGMTLLDFGLSDPANQGLRVFKSNWGAKEEALEYSFSRSARLPHGASHSRAQRLLGVAIRRSPPRVCERIGSALYRFSA
jgi:CelD/BcsL family acetyltransferase involved in cellulose biosynthesis